VYGIYYSFFEAFPLVYIDGYGLNLGQTGLMFLSITVGVLISIICYWSYVYFQVEPEIREHGLGAPERRLIPALIAAFLCPIGLFIFGKYSTVSWYAKLR
jgi:DHA1 family multidrug resistance protein-like MFS transporter